MLNPVPKPEPRAKAKAREQRRRVMVRRAVRETVYARESWRCQRCGRRVRLDVPEWAPNFAEVHEDPPRSLGGDPLDERCCILLCKLCHQGAHRR